MNSRTPCVSTMRVKALIGEEWDPACWNGNTREDLDEAGNTELLNTHESSSPVEASSSNLVDTASLPQSEEISPEVPEGSVMASPEEMSLKDTAAASQDPPPLSASRPVTGLQSQKGP